MKLATFSHDGRARISLVKGGAMVSTGMKPTRCRCDGNGVLCCLQQLGALESVCQAV